MSYQTYITEALIVGSFDSNTADKSYLLFTRDAGMIYAAAKSVREERSRQRFALQDFSRITVSLIKGKTGWRIGSVQSEGNLFVSAQSRAVRGSVVRLCKILRRFVAGEEPHLELYTEVMLGLQYLMQAEVKNRMLLEELLITRLLYSLGYIARTSELALILDNPFTTLVEDSKVADLLPFLQTINAQATTVSHL
jgi:recombinational DNA repair protein (RecF pathway)